MEKGPARRRSLGEAASRGSGLGPRGDSDVALSSPFPAAAAEGGVRDHSPRAAASPEPGRSPAANTSMAHAAEP